MWSIDGIKVILKKSKLLISINSIIKSAYLDYYVGRFKEEQRDAPEYWISAGTKNRFLDLFCGRERNKIKLLWIGANKNQDESGILPWLTESFDVTIFYNEDGSYGLKDGKDPANYSKDRLSNEMALGRYDSKDFDVVVGQFWGHLLTPKALMLFKQCFVINISMDDILPSNWGSRGGARFGAIGLASQCDLILTTFPPAVGRYKEAGVSSIFIPLASDGDRFCGHGSKSKYDISFVGNNYGVRRKIIDRLLKSGIEVAAFGNGFANGPVGAAANWKITSKSKIILGIGYVGHSKKTTTLKMRDFDALVSGNLYITTRDSALLKFFKEGVHVECYSTSVELEQKIRYYLKNNVKRVQIGAAGRKRALEVGTWPKIFSNVTEIIRAE